MYAHPLSVAPMLDWTDRHFRYFLRLISRHVLLYTEMVTCGAILQGDAHRHLDFDPREKPLVLQLGGSDPEALSRCVSLAEPYGYDAFNLNVGCPSQRVSQGRFGACLMKEPGLVAECIAAMRSATTLPVTVKCRIGVDDHDRYEDLAGFVNRVAAAGCRTFVVHARKAWLRGLSPRENRTVPPLCHDRVHRLKRDFPHLTIVLNGGIENLDQAREHLARVDGVMIGRAAYHNPWLLVEADRRFYGDFHPLPTRCDVFQDYLAYAARWLQAGVPLQSLTRHVLGLYHGQPGARRWRRHVTEAAGNGGIEALRNWLDSGPDGEHRDALRKSDERY